jgi:hypothetical protein
MIPQPETPAMPDRSYRGYRDADGTAHVMIVDDDRLRVLPMQLDLFNHSPTGFEWGYGGSGPAQLALALLADALDDDAIAVILHQRFKWKFIATMPQDVTWQMSRQEVVDKANLVKREIPNFDNRLEAMRS